MANNTIIQSSKPVDREYKRLIAQAVGMRLKELRLQNDLTLSALSRTTNKAITLLSRYEQGVKLPSLQTVFVLAKALKIEPGTLLNQAEKIRIKKVQVNDIKNDKEETPGL